MAQAPGADDVVTAAGQTVAVAASVSAVVLLGTAPSGTTGGLVFVNYADGIGVSASVQFADWYSNVAVGGGTVVATVRWNQPPTGIGPHDVSSYSWRESLATEGPAFVFRGLPTIADTAAAAYVERPVQEQGRRCMSSRSPRAWWTLSPTGPELLLSRWYASGWVGCPGWYRTRCGSASSW